MVLSTRTNCSLRWRACMALRCAWRSTNISETSRFGLSISYILRLMAISSTENGQCGVLPSFCPSKQAQVYAMLHRPRKAICMLLRTTGIIAGIVLLSGAAPALALDPTGDWRVSDGVANIRVAQCNGSMWGVVAWEKEPGGRDSNNPDASKRNRPTLGMPILLDMKHKPGTDQWEGQVYNAKDGQTYSSTITPTDANHLEIQGCVLGFLCGGETWTRVAPPIPSSPVNSMAKEGTPKAGAPKAPAAAPKTTSSVSTNAPAPAPAGQKHAALHPGEPVGDICLLPDIARFAH